MPENDTPTTGAAIQKLAQKEFAKKNTKRSDVQYKTGQPSEKVWDNYQLTKELKRQFKSLCKQNRVNASSYLRACVKAFVDADGDFKKALKNVKKLDTNTLESKED